MMNARADGLAIRNVAHLTSRSIAAALFLAALWMMLSGFPAGAETNSTLHPQNQFVRDCRALGGTTKRDSTHKVTCTFPDGAKWTCDFNHAPPTCTYKPAAKPAASTNGTLAGASGVPDATIEQTDAGVASTGDVSATGGTIVQATSDESPSFTDTEDGAMVELQEEEE
jgi:hypothetical protein